MKQTKGGIGNRISLASGWGIRATGCGAPGRDALLGRLRAVANHAWVGAGG
jgi:hypothetical protein